MDGNMRQVRRNARIETASIPIGTVIDECGIGNSGTGSKYYKPATKLGRMVVTQSYILQENHIHTMDSTTNLRSIIAYQTVEKQ